MVLEGQPRVAHKTQTKVRPKGRLLSAVVAKLRANAHEARLRHQRFRRVSYCRRDMPLRSPARLKVGR